ncbi:hypothetical protein ACT3SQ_17655, partial [Brachybacterium sp. AOP42-C2-15]|uniref:hypothetical protein n=1 Tax=Brachybacterium sp. AOP42-C2-15 TaxID=3457670 RepID=UPI00403452E9
MRDRSAVTAPSSQHHAGCECVRDTLDAPWKAELCTVLHARDEAELRWRLDAFLEGHLPEVRRVLARVKRVARLQWDDDDLAL